MGVSGSHKRRLPRTLGLPGGNRGQGMAQPTSLLPSRAGLPLAGELVSSPPPCRYTESPEARVYDAVR